MRRLLLGVFVILLGGCSSQAPRQEPLPQSRPTISEAVVFERQVDWSPVKPRRLRLLGVGDVPVVPLTLSGNTLVPPNDPKTLGWWGSQAGSRQGTTLLVGHTVHDGGGALDHLEEVAVGTDVNVSGVRYTVSSNRIISKAELARRAPHLFSQRGSHRLVVVTCEDYDPATGHYSSNVVLIAE